MTRSGRAHVVMLTRLPVPGAAKTRLVPALGADGAAAVHRQLTEQVAAEVAALAACGEAVAEVCHAGGRAGEMRAWLGPLLRYRPQPTRGDLGARLAAALGGALDAGAVRCVLVGSDCPEMTAGHLRRALAALDEADLVLGPAEDGGYWLIGLRAAAAARALPGLFTGISWGSALVLQQTRAQAAALGLSVAELETLADVDRPEDLARWRRQRDEAARPPRVSVVIPTLNEEADVAAAIDSARAAGAAEVVVADGGSGDATRAVAARAGAIVLEAPRGRARQMNAGAARAAGEVLLFLHADTRLPPASCAHVARALAAPGVVAGAFAFRADLGGWRGTVLTAGARLRCRLSGVPYGDQAIFVRRRVFQAVGGYGDLPIMEDWELVTRLRRLGRVVVLPQAAPTSAASFVDHGLVRASAVNVAVVVGYRLGVSPGRLLAWRAGVARRSA